MSDRPCPSGCPLHPCPHCCPQSTCPDGRRAMSDTPDVIDAIDMALEAWIDIENVQRVRDGLLRVFTEQQLVVVKAPGLSHGDELVQVEIDPITGEVGTQAAWLRRPVPENGDTQ